MSDEFDGLTPSDIPIDVAQKMHEAAIHLCDACGWLSIAMFFLLISVGMEAWRYKDKNSLWGWLVTMATAWVFAGLIIAVIMRVTVGDAHLGKDPQAAALLEYRARAERHQYSVEAYKILKEASERRDAVATGTGEDR